MTVVLTIRCAFSALFVCLILNILECLASFILIKKYTTIVIVIHKLSNIALITSFFFQHTFYDCTTLILYIISDTQPILALIEKKQYFLNFQYAVIFYASVSATLNKQLNDQLFLIFTMFVYFISSVPQYLFWQIADKITNNSSIQLQQSQIQNRQVQNQLHQLQLQSSRKEIKEFIELDQPNSAKMDSFLDNHELPFKKSNISIQLSSGRPLKQSEQISIEVCHQSQLQDKIWKQRLKSIPVGIALIDKNTNDFTYKNQYLDQMMTKTLQIEFEDYPAYLLNQLKFKVIDQGSEYKRSNFTHYFSMRQSKANIQVDFPGKTLTQSQQAHKKKGSESSKNISEFEMHHPQKVYSLNQIINKLQDGFFDNQLNDQDHTLELYCKYQLNVNNIIHLNLKVLYSPDQVEMTVIIQDYTRQNKLQRIEEQEEFKSKMISSFSHELRTPLNSATLFFKSALLDNRLDKQIRDNYILPGLSSLMRQSHLVNDIIDFSQINAEILELKYSEFYLKELIQELTQLFKFEFKAKKIGLAFKVDYNVPPTIKSDYQRLLQILINLLYNALKYSQHGYVLVTIKANDTYSNILFSIADEGDGITSQKLYQIQNVLKDHHTSTQDWNGFGLILSQMLLRYLGPLQNNDLIINSQGLGLGTTVQFNINNHININDYYVKTRKNIQAHDQILTLPDLDEYNGLLITIKSQTQSKQILNIESKQILNQSLTSYKAIDDFMKIPDAQTHLVSELNLLYKNGRINKAKSFKILKPQEQKYQKCNCRTILSVDDEIFNQQSLTCILQKFNFEIETAYNGQQAIKMIEQKNSCGQQCRKYLLILMDCQMPVLDGWQTSRILKQKFQQGILKPIPIVGFTAFTSKQDLEQCKQVGMIEVLNKPLQVKKLKCIMEKLNLL
ncbi:unnamed protein product [Paramecium sonneborni]|uniref:Uncharacterized protein n=1 Tax=Paramecium sonneborni TaxID=65129 RepID=A0A8S1Q3K8_9CILI|nr:unnamed protein product [Paramecium sonneborni]